jgi:hypothetical protein
MKRCASLNADRLFVVLSSVGLEVDELMKKDGEFISSSDMV